MHYKKRNHKKRAKIFIFLWLGLFLLNFWQKDALAGVFEMSFGFSFSESNYSDSNFSWNRRWGASLGYYFTELSEIELAYQDIFTRNRISGYEDTSFHDQIYSIDWVQSLTSRNAFIQPYFKLGVGQLNREATGTYFFGVAPPAILDSLTVVLGAGLRLYLTRSFAVRGEATTYLVGGSISTYKDNFGFTLGVSLYF